MKHELPKLNYAFNALAPYIDERTMDIHYNKHHATYVAKLNEALDKHPELYDRNIKDLLADLNSVPEDIRPAVRNHGGGHLNHTLYWEFMSPDGGTLKSGKLLDKINEQYSSLDVFKKEFLAVSLARFGSGWTWLIKTKEGSLKIESSANQDSPISNGERPILGIDLWEHAYYLNYQNRRQEYVEKFWNIVNWNKVEKLFAK